MEKYKGAVVVATSRTRSTEIARLPDGSHISVFHGSRRDIVEAIPPAALEDYCRGLTVRPNPPYPLGEVREFAQG